MWKRIVQSIILGLVAAVIVIALSPQDKLAVKNLFAPQPMSFNQAVRIASPAVVNVYSQSFEGNLQDPQSQITNLGSGVIMSPNGYILTNKHVIANAQQIIVALQSGRIFTARLVGSDSLTDLAVLKIHSTTKLPTIPQNPDRPLQVGDVVLAIGNPYNLGQSVSQGIVSALGRNVIGDYAGRQDLIQTDASINRGNSGGALINSLGELIAINTLSIGKNTQDLAEGLNFAIPIQLATRIMRDIIKDGRVIRGYLGVQSNILFNNGTGKESEGVLVTAIAPQSPAAVADIMPNDVILKYGDTIITSPAQLMRLVIDTRPNTTVNIQIRRLGKILTVPVMIGELNTESE